MKSIMMDKRVHVCSGSLHEPQSDGAALLDPLKKRPVLSALLFLGFPLKIGPELIYKRFFWLYGVLPPVCSQFMMASMIQYFAHRIGMTLAEFADRMFQLGNFSKWEHYSMYIVGAPSTIAPIAVTLFAKTYGPKLSQFLKDFSIIDQKDFETLGRINAYRYFTACP